MFHLNFKKRTWALGHSYTYFLTWLNNIFTGQFYKALLIYGEFHGKWVHRKEGQSDKEIFTILLTWDTSFKTKNLLPGELILSFKSDTFMEKSTKYLGEQSDFQAEWLLLEKVANYWQVRAAFQNGGNGANLLLVFVRTVCCWLLSHTV